jgi:hypothetical protein
MLLSLSNRMFTSVADSKSIPAVEGPQAEIRRYLALDGCKFWPGEAHVSSRESRMFFEFKVELGEF